MKFKEKSLEELDSMLKNIGEEQVTMEELSVSLPEEIADKKEKLRKKRVAYMNAKGWYEESVEYLDRVKSRKNQLAEIVDDLKAEIALRQVRQKGIVGQSATHVVMDEGAPMERETTICYEDREDIT